MSPGTDWHVAVVVENLPVGVDTRLRKQVRDLSAAGHRVSVVTMRDPANGPLAALPGVELLEYPPPGGSGGGLLGYAREYSWSLAWAAVMLTRLRRRGPVDVLHLSQPPDVYFPLARALKWTGTRVVVDQRDLMPELLAQRSDGAPGLLDSVLRWLERRSQAVADASVVVNEYLRDRLVEAGAAPDSITIVRNGPVLERVATARADPDLRRGRDHLVCWAGKMGRQDRVDLVLEVAEHVVRVLGRDDCTFVLLGDGECLDQLRAEVAERGLSGVVHLPGWLSEAEVFAHLATADVGIDTSLQHEVSPVKALEYMALGLPVVSFDLRETRRICSGAGILVPAPDTKALAEAVVGLLDDPAERRRLGEVGRTRVRDDLGWEHQRQRYLDVVGPPVSRRAASQEP